LFVKGKIPLCGLAIAVALQLGMLAGSAQTNIYLFSGSKTTITLNPGTYIITAYGASSRYSSLIYIDEYYGGSGAEMSAEFNFSTSTNLTLLVGGAGNGLYASGSGGGGGSFVVEGSTPLVIAGGGGGTGQVESPGGNGNVSTSGGGGGAGGAGGGNSGGGAGGGGFLGNGGNGVDYYGGGGGSSFETGGGYGHGGNGIYPGGYGGYGGGGGGGGGGSASVGSYHLGGGGGGSIIDSSAIAILNEVSGILSPDDLYNGEIIITAVPTPLVITTTGAAFGFTNGVFGFNLIGPSGSNVVIQASADLQTWIPLQTNLLGSGLLYFSDPQSTNNVQRFYRAQLSP
jgi:hypothetical protein